MSSITRAHNSVQQRLPIHDGATATRTLRAFAPIIIISVSTERHANMARLVSCNVYGNGEGYRRVCFKSEPRLNNVLYRGAVDKYPKIRTDSSQKFHFLQRNKHVERCHIIARGRVCVTARQSIYRPFTASTRLAFLLENFFPPSHFLIRLKNIWKSHGIVSGK